MRPRLALALLCNLSACGGGEGSSSFGGMTQPWVTGAPGGSESSAGEASTSTSANDGPGSTSSAEAASTSIGSSTAGTVWDMGAPDFGPVQPAGCQGKIDFLFVISTQGTMSLQQDKLLAAFPEFMAEIEAQVPEFDVHILSANTNTKLSV